VAALVSLGAVCDAAVGVHVSLAAATVQSHAHFGVA
jgi:hypothetical protein